MCTCAHAPKCIHDCSGCQVSGSNRHVVNRGVVICHVVASIIRAWHPIVPKLTLMDAIAPPVELHVHGFRPSWGNGILDNAQRCCVVHLDGRQGLGVDHLE